MGLCFHSLLLLHDLHRDRFYRIACCHVKRKWQTRCSLNIFRIFKAVLTNQTPPRKAIKKLVLFCRLCLKHDSTRSETRFRLPVKWTSPFKSADGFSSVDCWQASCVRQSAGFVLLVQTCVLQSCDAYWLPTPFSCFPVTSPPVRHRVPSHFKWILSHCDRLVVVTETGLELFVNRFFLNTLFNPLALELEI